MCFTHATFKFKTAMTRVTSVLHPLTSNNRHITDLTPVRPFKDKICLNNKYI